MALRTILDRRVMGGTRVGDLLLGVLVALAALYLLVVSMWASCPAGRRSSASPVTERLTMTMPPPAEVAALEAIYAAAAQDINQQLARAITRIEAGAGSNADIFAAQRSAALLRSIDTITARASAAGSARITELTRLGYEDGATRAINEARALGWTPPDGDARSAAITFGSIDESAIRVIASDSAARLSAGLDQHGQQAAGLLRTLSLTGDLRQRVSEQSVNTALARGLVQGDPRQIERNIRELFADPNAPEALSYRKLGNQQIEVGGWTGSVRTYTRMVSITRTREAVTKGSVEKSRQNRLGLKQVIGSTSVNFCTRFLRVVVAISEEFTEGGRYPLLSSLPRGGPPFHPYCGKNLATYIAQLVDSARAGAAARAFEKFEQDRAAGRLLSPLQPR